MTKKWKITDKKKKRKEEIIRFYNLSKMKYFNLLLRTTVIFLILLICLLGYEILFLLFFIILFRECNVGGIIIKILKYFFPLFLFFYFAVRLQHTYSTVQLLCHADTN